MDPRALLDTWLTSGTLRPSTVGRYRPQVDDWLTWCETNGVHPYHARIEHVAKWSEKRLLPCLSMKSEMPARICRSSALPLPMRNCHSLKSKRQSSSALPGGQGNNA